MQGPGTEGSTEKLLGPKLSTRAQTARHGLRHVGKCDVQKRGSEMQRSMLDMLTDVRDGQDSRISDPVLQDLPSHIAASQEDVYRKLADELKGPLGSSIRKRREDAICDERRYLVSSLAASMGSLSKASTDTVDASTMPPQIWRGRQPPDEDLQTEQEMPAQVVHRHHHHHHHHHYFPEQKIPPGAQQHSLDVLDDTEGHRVAVVAGDFGDGDEHRHFHHHHHVGELQIPMRHMRVRGLRDQAIVSRYALRRLVKRNATESHHVAQGHLPTLR